MYYVLLCSRCVVLSLQSNDPPFSICLRFRLGGQSVKREKNLQRKTPKARFSAISESDSSSGFEDQPQRKRKRWVNVDGLSLSLSLPLSLSLSLSLFLSLSLSLPLSLSHPCLSPSHSATLCPSLSLSPPSLSLSLSPCQLNSTQLNSTQLIHIHIGLSRQPVLMPTRRPSTLSKRTRRGQTKKKESSLAQLDRQNTGYYRVCLLLCFLLFRFSCAVDSTPVSVFFETADHSKGERESGSE
jgi:hypothetical protein